MNELLFKLFRSPYVEEALNCLRRDKSVIKMLLCVQRTCCDLNPQARYTISFLVMDDLLLSDEKRCDRAYPFYKETRKFVPIYPVPLRFRDP